MIAGSSSIFLKSIWNKSCSWATLLKFWFRTDLGRKNSTGFYMQGRQSPLTFLTVTRWSCSTSNFYVLIGQNLTGEFMRKIYATQSQSHWKSDFGWHCFQRWAYSLALNWGVRGLKSLKQFWNTWWPSEAASRLVSLIIVFDVFYGILLMKTFYNGRFQKISIPYHGRL